MPSDADGTLLEIAKHRATGAAVSVWERSWKSSGGLSTVTGWMEVK